MDLVLWHGNIPGSDATGRIVNVSGELRAERHYSADGWCEATDRDALVIFRQALTAEWIRRNRPDPYRDAIDQLAERSAKARRMWP